MKLNLAFRGTKEKGFTQILREKYALLRSLTFKNISFKGQASLKSNSHTPLSIREANKYPLRLPIPLFHSLISRTDIPSPIADHKLGVQGDNAGLNKENYFAQLLDVSFYE